MEREGGRCNQPGALEEVAAQHGPRAGQPHLHGVLAHPERLGSFGGAEALDLSKHEHLAAAVWEAVNGRLHDERDLPCHRLPFGIGL
jgi:hypothetical protein